MSPSLGIDFCLIISSTIGVIGLPRPLERQAYDKRVTIKGKSCRQDYPCGTYDEKYYWCYTSDDWDWDYCCWSDCDRHGWLNDDWCTTREYKSIFQTHWEWCCKSPNIVSEHCDNGGRREYDAIESRQNATDESVREAENTMLDRPVVTTRPAKTFDYVKQEMNWANARNELPGVAGGGGVGSD